MSLADEDQVAMARYEQLNESDVDLDLQRKQTRLDYKKVLQYVKVNSPTTDKGEYYSCCEACCTVTTGFHFCGETTRRSDLEKYGVGIVLYFKFVKYLIFFFVIFSILSIPSLYYCITAYKRYNTYSSLTLNYALQATTIGAIGLGKTIPWKFRWLYLTLYDFSGSTSCGLAQTPSQTNDTSKQLVSFSCPDGTLLSYENVVYGFGKEIIP